ncbi:MAG: amino acid permease [Chloroflexi bacterium]|nr:amino acid permease [Chloroflexota bacterium]
MQNQSHQANGEQKVALSRDLGLFTITMIGVGGMIGAGIFVLTGIAAGVAGPALALAFLLNGIVTTFTAMAYAELGSAFPEAGGGYLWVKEGLGGANGFLAGWMSWFAHAVAGSLYALAFGRFASELWSMAGIPAFGLSLHQMTLVFTSLVILAFTIINYRGASETGTVGNIVTSTKVVILALFVEGYEIIAQSGEEVIHPKRNIPRAIFAAILISVVFYIAVGTVAVGAVMPPRCTRWI